MKCRAERLAPVAIFAFKRPAHLRRTLDALAANPEFIHSPLHIFCDGARRPNEEALVAEVQSIAMDWPHPEKVVVVAQANQGLARSVINGVSLLCEQYGRVIVVEDDLRVAINFLSYMNQALDRFADTPEVMQISGHMFAVDVRTEADAVFLPFTTSWGWATWSRAWRAFDPDMTAFPKVANSRHMRRRFNLDGSYPYFSMLKRQREGKIDSWAIRWYLSVFEVGGLVLYPKCSLVANDGFDGSGTHCPNTGFVDELAAESFLGDRSVLRLPEPRVDDQTFALVRTLLGKENSLARRAWRKVRGVGLTQ